MASDLEILANQIKTSNLEETFKENILNTLESLFNSTQELRDQRDCYHQQLNQLKDKHLIVSEKLIDVQDQLIDAKNKIIQGIAGCYEMPVSKPNTQSAPMDVSPPPNIPVGPKLIKNGATGVVKFFNIERRYGIISYTQTENEKETLKEAFIHATNISKSTIEKPEERNLQPKETVIFDLYQIGNEKFVAKNVTGPNDTDVKGVYVVYQNKTQRSKMPNQCLSQNYRNQAHPRNQSRPRRSYSIRRNPPSNVQRQNPRSNANDYQQPRNNIFRSRRQF